MNRQQLLTWPPLVIALVLVCSLLWGSAFPLLKIGFGLLRIEENIGGKLYFAGYRFLLAGLLIFAGMIILRKPIMLPGKRDYLALALIGLLQTSLQYTFFYIGLSHTTGVKASIITGSGSFYLALFSHWWMGEDTLGIEKVIGLVVGFTGLVLINLKSQLLDLDFRFSGEGFIFLGVLCSAMATFLVKKASVRVYPPLMVAYQLTLGSVVLLIVALGMESPSVLCFSKSTVWLLMFLSFVSAAAFPVWYVLVKYNQLTKMAVYRFLIPVCGTFLSAAILDTESLSGLALVSLALVSAGMVLTSRAPTEPG